MGGGGGMRGRQGVHEHVCLKIKTDRTGSEISVRRKINN